MGLSSSPLAASDVSWFNTAEYLDLARTHGLSVLLPLGENPELAIPITATGATRNLTLLDMYTCEQLEFLCSDPPGRPGWGKVVDAYYADPPLADVMPGPRDGLAPPEVAPPTTASRRPARRRWGRKSR